MPSPEGLDTIILDAQASAAEEYSNANVVNKPSPGAIVAPENEYPNIAAPPKLTLKPAASAAPPDAPVAVAPSKLNWKPPIASELE